jgi:Uma2 family endonuclease
MPVATKLSVHEYLEQERSSNVRHEYRDGEIRAMSGGNEAHSLVKVNVVSSLHSALSETSNWLYNSDLKIKLPKAKLYTYPDASVAVGEPLFEGTRREALLNPTLIVEVLSKSTESYDRGEKFELYQTLESFTDYLLVSQNSYRVEHYVLQTDDTWLLKIYRGLEARVIISSIGCTLALSDIYKKVNLEQDPTP